MSLYESIYSNCQGFGRVSFVTYLYVAYKKNDEIAFLSRRRYASGIKINCHKIFTVRVTRCVNSARRFEYARVKAISNRKIILSKMRRHHRRYYSISFSGISFDDEEARK